MRCVNLGRRIPNGRVNIVPFNKFGAVAKYTCNDGYELKGLAIRVCQGNEEWSGQEPRCVLTTRVPDKTECGRPPDVANADFYQNRGNSTYPLGTMLEYTCRDGFQKGKNDADKAWCVGMGTWVGPRMKCYTAGCPKPSPIENGGIKEPFVNGVGAIMTYYCVPGFHLAGRPTRECRPSGVWDGKEPSCEKGKTMTCTSPPVITHANHDGPKQPRYSAGFQLTYNCDMGYIRESDPRIMCGDDGEVDTAGTQMST
ncbi:hypothetical protein FSP39_025445 [Pinctada imbricata]|uniref:Sushi domain-containing protein n=1 Tax=Pinctada imbricata TaxID=66713 RepID=A0AA89BN24_PINIB|nr:hypothetical protein FSP39_025445 [Pinctada imbricata]